MNEKMTIDIHTHLGPNRMEVDRITKDDLGQQVDLLLSQMDEHGIEKAVLTPIEPKIATDFYIEAANMYPDRLIAACSVVPRPLYDSRKRLLRYVDEGCCALILDDSQYHPRDPDAQAIVQQAAENGLTIMFHSLEISNEILSFVDSLSTVYPDAKFVILHMGGLFGFAKILPLIQRSNVWTEISVTLVKLVESPLRVFLDAFTQDIGVRKLVFGSEHHTEYPDLFAAINLIDLNIETSKMVTQENAKRIFADFL